MKRTQVNVRNLKFPHRFHEANRTDALAAHAQTYWVLGRSKLGKTTRLSPLKF